MVVTFCLRLWLLHFSNTFDSTTLSNRYFFLRPITPSQEATLDSRPPLTAVVCYLNRAIWNGTQDFYLLSVKVVWPMPLQPPHGISRWVEEWDSNPRSLEPQSSALDQLSYQPHMNPISFNSPLTTRGVKV